MHPFLQKTTSILRNKYYFSLIAFVLWITFFDNNNVYEIYRLRKNYAELYRQKEFYVRETARVTAEKQELFGSDKALEKFARERYFMKKDDEDIFIFESPKKPEE